jgi:hypothetical protein
MHKQWWADSVWKLYAYMPDRMEETLRRSKARLIPWLAFRLPVAVLRGVAQHTGKPACMVTAGAQPWIDCIPQRFFAEPPQRQDIGTFPVWTLPTLLQRLGASADMVVARIDRRSAQRFFTMPYLAVPESVGCALTVPDDLSQLQRGNHSVKEDLRIIRREALRYDVSYAVEDCEKFYHTMHLPFVHNRHGEFAVLHSLPALRHAVRRGGILWVWRGDQCIAGSVYRRYGQTFHAVALGTLGGDLELKKAGALAALYYFFIQHAHRLGCTRIDFGGTPSLLNHGLLRYKRKWGAELVREAPTPYDYLLWWPQPNAQVGHFLEHNAMIFRHYQRLAALTTVAAPQESSVDDLARQLRSLVLPGLEQLFVLAPGGWPAEIRTGILRSLQSMTRTFSCELVFCETTQFLATRDHSSWP